MEVIKNVIVRVNASKQSLPGDEIASSFPGRTRKDRRFTSKTLSYEAVTAAGISADLDMKGAIAAATLC